MTSACRRLMRTKARGMGKFVSEVHLQRCREIRHRCIEDAVKKIARAYTKHGGADVAIVVWTRFVHDVRTVLEELVP